MSTEAPNLLQRKNAAASATKKDDSVQQTVQTTTFGKDISSESKYSKPADLSLRCCCREEN